jgi:hypothetical protein
MNEHNENIMMCYLKMLGKKKTKFLRRPPQQGITDEPEFLEMITCLFKIQYLPAQNYLTECALEVRTMEELSELTGLVKVLRDMETYKGD